MANDLRTLIEEALVDVATDVVSLEGLAARLRSDVDALASGGSAVIDDTAASTAAAYSSSKVESLLANAIATALANLANGAPDALNEIKELAAALGNDADFGAKVLDSLSKRVRFDQAQTLTTAQQLQVRTNIDAVGTAQIGDTTTSLAAVYAAAKQ